MQRSSARIHVTHAGRLESFSKAFEQADRGKSRGQPYDCGMGGGRIHCEIGWAKLEASIAGARPASERLWRRAA